MGVGDDHCKKCCVRAFAMGRAVIAAMDSPWEKQKLINVPLGCLVVKIETDEAEWGGPKSMRQCGVIWLLVVCGACWTVCFDERANADAATAQGIRPPPLPRQAGQMQGWPAREHFECDSKGAQIGER